MTDIAKAIAVFDKSADRTIQNAQTEAWKVLRAELHRLLAIAEGAEADRADAKRYRFIRAGKSRGDVDLCVCKADWKYHSRAILCDDEADAAIDAALAGAVTQGEENA